MERNCILPDDLIQDILSRLTVRDLLRLRCVSKDWCALVDNPSFIKKNYQVHYSIRKVDGNLPHFVDVGCTGYMIEPDTNKFYLLSIRQGNLIFLDLNADLEHDSKDGINYGLCLFDLVVDGCVNGIICLTWNNKHDLFKEYLGLWNPATREFKTVAAPNVLHKTAFEIRGFGFDPLSNDFKIIGSYGFMGESEPNLYYEMYSLRTNFWKTLSGPPVTVAGVPSPLTDGYLNGVYYWSTVFVEESGGDLVIVSFNFSSEVFKVSDLPEDAVSLVSGIYPFQVTTTLYKESLGLFISHEVQEEATMYNVDVWVVTQFDDCGVPLSWQHLFTVRPTPAKLGLKVSTTLINGDLLLTYQFPSEDNYGVEDVEDCLYNPSTGEFKMLGKFFCTYYRYVESLYSLSL